jgi:Tol biopolymer transport system component
VLLEIVIAALCQTGAEEPVIGAAQGFRPILTVPSNHFAAGDELVNVDLRGGVSRLAEKPLVGYQPAWSPDGTRIAFERDSRIYVANADGQQTREIAKSEGQLFNWVGSPAWSPDGKTIAYAARAGSDQIRLVNADGTGSRTLSARPKENRFPAWSPDGAHIAFGWFTPQDQFRLCLIAPDGSGFTDLDVVSNYWCCPAWSPDGRLIAFDRHDGQGHQVHIVELASKKVQRISSGPQANQYTAWSTDGRYLAYVHYDVWDQSTAPLLGDLMIYDILLETHTKLLSGLPRFGSRPSWKPILKPAAAADRAASEAPKP